MRIEGYGLYRLVKENNAIFIHESLSKVVGGVGIDEIACYSEAIRSEATTLVFAHWAYIHEWEALPPQEALARVWCNVSIHDWLRGISNVPFSLAI